MPRLSQWLTPPEVAPTQTGQPRGVVEIPTVTLPQVPSNLGQAIPTAVGQFGAQVAQDAQALRHEAAQAAALNTRIQLAAAKTQGLKAYNLYEPQLDTFAADERLKGDPDTYPQRLAEYDKQLRAQLSQQLSPQAREVFDLKAGERYGVVNREAQHYRVTETLKQGVLAVDEAQAQFIRGQVGNANPDDVSQRAAGFLRTMQDFEALGVIPRGDGARRLRVAQEAVQAEETDRYTAAVPDLMLPHLLDVQRGGQGHPGLPLPPVTLLAEKIEKARTQSRALVNEQEHVTRVQEKRLEQQQLTNERQYRARLSEIVPIPDNIGQYDTLLKEVNAAATASPQPQITTNAQGELHSLIRTLRTAAQNPPQVDDPTTERRLSLLVHAADNPSDFTAVRQEIVTSAQRLKPETVRTFLQILETRQDRNHWSNLPGVKAGYRTIYGGDMVEGVTLPMLRAADKADAENRVVNAIHAYNARIRAMAEGEGGKPGSASRTNAEAPTIADEVWRTFVLVPGVQTKLEMLPIPLQGPEKKGIQDELEARRIVHEMKLPKAESERLMDRWRHWNLLHLKEKPENQRKKMPWESDTGNTGTTGSAGRKQG